MKTKGFTAAVQAFRCGACDRLYLKKKDADECCKCEVCGVPFKKSIFERKCAHCIYPERLKRLRYDARTKGNEYRHAQRALERFLLVKRPPKGAPIR